MAVQRLPFCPDELPEDSPALAGPYREYWTTQLDRVRKDLAGIQPQISIMEKYGAREASEGYGPFLAVKR